MSQESRDLVRVPEEPTELAEPRRATAPQQISPVALVLSLLRGRYWLLVPLAILGIIAGAWLGYRMKPPQYRSWGLVHIKPYVNKRVYETEQNEVLRYFDTYMQAQVALIKTSKLVSMAMRDPRWQELNRDLSPGAIDAFGSSLDVTYSGELISIAFVHNDPEATARAVNSMIDAYQSIYKEQDVETNMDRMETLERTRDGFEAELKGYNQKVLAIGKDMTAKALEKQYEYKLEELNKAESRLRLAALALQAAEARVGRRGGPTTGPVDPKVAALRDEPAAYADAMMAKLNEERAAEEIKLGRAIMQWGEHHPTVVTQRAYLTRLRESVDAFNKAAEGFTGNGISMAAKQKLEDLREDERIVREDYAKLSADTSELGRKNVEIEMLRMEAERVRKALEDTQSRIDKLRLEQNVGGRISVMTYGDPPVRPDKDKRMTMAAGGGAGGAAAAVAVVMLIGFLNRRMRDISDAKLRLPQTSTLLGVLPSLPKDFSDPEQAAIAAHCVHQIRTTLQIQQGVNQHRVLSVTSPSPGDGKTSLAIALAMSYAQTGSKTLLIDCDIHGRALTTRLNSSVACRLGQILLRRHKVSEEDLASALSQAKSTGRRLGEVLVARRLVEERDVERALQMQSRLRAGLGAVIRGHALTECVLPTGIANLSLLRLGSGDATLRAPLAPTTIKMVLDMAAEQYDTVLVDTGPILGSLEAAVVASEVDGVVLTISCGGQRHLAKNAINYLNSMNAHIEGVVFNRAQPNDIVRSGYSSSVSSVSRPDGANTLALTGADHRHRSRLGPVADSLSVEVAPIHFESNP